MHHAGQGFRMFAVQVVDPALCRSSAVCGQHVDALCVQAAADIDWAKCPGALIDVVGGCLDRYGQDAPPAAVLDGQLVLAGRNPRQQPLRQWAGHAAPWMGPASLT